MERVAEVAEVLALQEVTLVARHLVLGEVAQVLATLITMVQQELVAVAVDKEELTIVLVLVEAVVAVLGATELVLMVQAVLQILVAVAVEAVALEMTPVLGVDTVVLE